MKYQLVIQFSEALYGDIDWIADLEDQLDNALIDAELDGDDIGSGEVNVFIHCNNPVNAFDTVKSILQEDDVALNTIKAAYREIMSDHFIPLWPKNLKNFKII